MSARSRRKSAATLGGLAAAPPASPPASARRGRILALFLFAATIAAGGGVYGPWMRVTALGHSGDAYTPTGRVQEILDDYRGADPGRRPRRAARPVGRAADGGRCPHRAAAARRAAGRHHREGAGIPVAHLRAVLVGARDGTIIAELGRSEALRATCAGCHSWRTSVSCRACCWSATPCRPPNCERRSD